MTSIHPWQSIPRTLFWQKTLMMQFIRVKIGRFEEIFMAIVWLYSLILVLASQSLINYRNFGYKKEGPRDYTNLVLKACICVINCWAVTATQLWIALALDTMQTINKMVLHFNFSPTLSRKRQLANKFLRIFCFHLIIPWKGYSFI